MPFFEFFLRNNTDQILQIKISPFGRLFHNYRKYLPLVFQNQCLFSCTSIPTTTSENKINYTPTIRTLIFQLYLMVQISYKQFNDWSYLINRKIVIA